MMSLLVMNPASARGNKNRQWFCFRYRQEFEHITSRKETKLEAYL